MATMTANMETMSTMPASGRKAQSRTESIAERNRRLFDVQLRCRRGPTPEVFFPKHIDNSRIVKVDDPDRRREMRSFAAAMTALFVLVMVFVAQHFSAIEIGYQIESSKQQVDQLREENRQLRLTEAQLTEPARIDRIARQLGLDAPQPGQVVRTDGADMGITSVAQTHAPALPVN